MKIKITYCSEWNDFESEDEKKVFDNDIAFVTSSGRYIKGHKLRTYIPKHFKTRKGKWSYSSLWEIFAITNGYIVLNNGKISKLEKLGTSGFELKNIIQIQNDNLYNLFVTNKTLTKEVVTNMLVSDMKSKKPATVK